MLRSFVVILYIRAKQLDQYLDIYLLLFGIVRIFVKIISLCR